MIRHIKDTIRRCDTLTEDFIGGLALVGLLISALYFPVIF